MVATPGGRGRGWPRRPQGPLVLGEGGGQVVHRPKQVMLAADWHCVVQSLSVVLLRSDSAHPVRFPHQAHPGDGCCWSSEDGQLIGELAAAVVVRSGPGLAAPMWHADGTRQKKAAGCPSLGGVAGWRTPTT